MPVKRAAALLRWSVAATFPSASGGHAARQQGYRQKPPGGSPLREGGAAGFLHHTEPLRCVWKHICHTRCAARWPPAPGKPERARLAGHLLPISIVRPTFVVKEPLLLVYLPLQAGSLLACPGSSSTAHAQAGQPGQCGHIPPTLDSTPGVSHSKRGIRGMERQDEQQCGNY
jgi:hypothetical protein